MILKTATLFVLLPTLFAQRAVDPGNLHERLIAVVPLVGAGTYADPRRPLFAPARAGQDGILSWSFEAADTGNLVIVELVARNRGAFAAILADNRALLRFVKGQADPVVIEREVRRFKRDFVLNKSARRSQ